MGRSFPTSPPTEKNREAGMPEPVKDPFPWKPLHFVATTVGPLPIGCGCVARIRLDPFCRRNPCSPFSCMFQGRSFGQRVDMIRGVFFPGALGYVIVGESECGFEDGSECFFPWFAVDTLA